MRTPDRPVGRGCAALVALATAALLGGCAPAENADALFAALGSEDVEARQEAADKIESIVESGGYAVFVRGLDSKVPLNRATSIIQLARMPQPGAREALRAQLAVGRRVMLPYNPIRVRPARELSDSRILVANLIHRGGGDPAALGVLLAGVEENRPADLLEGTCFAVGALGDPAGIPFLEKAARHPELAVARAAVQALGQFQEPEAVTALGRLVQHPAMEVRSDVITSLAGRDDEATRALLRSMGESDPAPELRASAYSALSRLNDPALVPYLIDRLKDAQGPARDSAAETLARITGQSLGTKPEPWQRWWARNHAATPPR
ncbi:MAG TPA: HEAT repeat domain-containing protein [Candidatus Cryosericum sp.]|nr:HEAT repeat domain-containing protein [Candidatus Cryosericum sp.]